MPIDDAPLTTAEFSPLIAPLVPSLRMAVAVSGGADSMALCLLAHDWATAMGGAVVALTVDHGLRPESAAEAATVGQRLAVFGIPHRLLHWSGPKPSTGIQEAARDARYRLLIQACLELELPDLLLGHHRQDQAETVLLRLTRGSGVDGLAGMAAVRRHGPLRLLRPLLSVAKSRLVATCRAAGVAWVEDPSNHAPAFARTRLRAAAGVLAEAGLTTAALWATAARAAETRACLEAATDDLLAKAATPFVAGTLLLDPVPLAGASEGLGRRSLARCLTMIGGGGYPVRRERLERLWQELLSGLTAGRTLGGCLIMPQRGGRLLLAREPAAIHERLALESERPVWWDRRFVISAKAAGFATALSVAGLGEVGRRALREVGFDSAATGVPAVVQPSLPAIWSEAGLAAVPHLGYRRSEWVEQARVRLEPAGPLVGNVGLRREVAWPIVVV
ncbi:tRNA(Ile)-lysidine synthase [uncultured Gammaproteobacteria bacterium]